MTRGRMTQADIYNFLKKNKGKKFTNEQIVDKLKMSKGCCNKNLNVMFKHQEIKREIVTIKKNMINYKGRLQTIAYKNMLYWVEE